MGTRMFAGLFCLLLWGFGAPRHNAGQDSASKSEKSAANGAVPTVNLPKELDRVLRDYESAWQAKDAAALAKLFADDGFVLPSGRPMVRGRKAIEQYYQGHGGSLSLRAVAHAASGDVGYIIGAYTDKPGSPDQGKFTLTLKKDRAGRWLIMSDMDNSNRRPGQPPSGSTQ